MGEAYLLVDSKSPNNLVILLHTQSDHNSPMGGTYHHFQANRKYRLVQDFRMLNLVTDCDVHPLPRIIDILHRQGKFKIGPS